MGMKVTIMCGVSGSGKSTYVISNHPNAMVFAIDNYLSYDKSTYHNKDALQNAYRNCLRDYIFTLSQHSFFDRCNDIVVDNANTTITGISPFISVAQAYECEVEVILVECDPVKAWRRNQHNVKLEDIEAQQERLTLLPERWSSWWPPITIVKGE